MTTSTFIELPQSSVQVLTHHSLNDDAAPVTITVTTWTGDDICALSKSELEKEILSVTRQTALADLKENGVGIHGASLDPSSKEEKLMDEMQQKFFSFTCAEIFKTSCPGITNKPSDAITSISQEYTDETGNYVTLTVQMFFTRIFAACQTQDKKQYDVCAVNHAYHNLTETIRNECEQKGYTLRRHPRDPKSQAKALQELLRIATGAEKSVANTQLLIKQSTTTALLASGVSMRNDEEAIDLSHSPVEEEATPVVTFASQAERTIAQYKTDDMTRIPNFTWTFGNCLGCGGNHLWRDRANRITCPNAHRPGAYENMRHNSVALREYQDEHFNDDKRKRPYSSGTTPPKRKEHLGPRYGTAPDYNRFSNEQKAGFIKNLLSNPKVAADLTSRLGTAPPNFHEYNPLDARPRGDLHFDHRGEGEPHRHRDPRTEFHAPPHGDHPFDHRGEVGHHHQRDGRPDFQGQVDSPYRGPTSRGHPQGPTSNSPSFFGHVPRNDSRQLDQYHHSRGPHQHGHSASAYSHYGPRPPYWTFYLLKVLISTHLHLNSFR